jgi:hypothetical protein
MAVRIVIGQAEFRFVVITLLPAVAVTASIMMVTLLLIMGFLRTPLWPLQRQAWHIGAQYWALPSQLITEATTGASTAM